MMSALSRVVGRELVGKTTQAGFWLLCMYLFVSLLEFVDDYGTNAGIGAILQLLVLSIPRILYELAPMMVMVGTLLALTALARRSELIAMHASGISSFKLTTIIVKFGMLFAVGIYLLGEFAIPITETKSGLLVQSLKSREAVEQAGDSQVWGRDADQFIRIGGTDADGSMLNVLILRFSHEGHLEQRIDAARGVENLKDDTFVLFDVLVRNFEGIHVTQQQHERFTYKQPPAIHHIYNLGRDPYELNNNELRALIDHLDSNGLSSDIYDLAYWNRFVFPLTIIASIVIAVPFAGRGKRRKNAGYYVFAGLMIGLAFYAIQQSIGYIVLLSGIPPLTGSLSSLVIFTSCALYALRHT